MDADYEVLVCMRVSGVRVFIESYWYISESLLHIIYSLAVGVWVIISHSADR